MHKHAGSGPNGRRSEAEPAQGPVASGLRQGAVPARAVKCRKQPLQELPPQPRSAAASAWCTSEGGPCRKSAWAGRGAAPGLPPPLTPTAQRCPDATHSNGRRASSHAGSG